MPIKDFSSIYNKYVDTPEKKFYASQIDEQLKVSVLLREMREREFAKKEGNTWSAFAHIENSSMNVTFDTITEVEI